MTTELSIIILTYNTKEMTLDAVKSIEKNYEADVHSGRFDVIVCDNASTDDTLAAFEAYKKTSKIKNLVLVDNEGNLGFSKGNNKGVPFAKGKYVLFLNPDTNVYPKTLNYMLDFMDAHPDCGTASCQLINKEGEIDFNCHRGFPTPWNSFCYFSGVIRLFPKSHLFAGYTMGWGDMHTTHQVDAIEGAFMIMPRNIGEKVGWWNEDYFFYGEDLQFCYDIRKLGYKIYYVGEVSIMHIGGASSGIKKKTQNITSANRENKIRLQNARFDAMKIFYKKNYQKQYPAFITSLIYWVIDLKRKNTIAQI